MSGKYAQRSNWRERKRDLRARLCADGRWREFILRRDGLKRDGMAPREAWAIAAAEFPPIQKAPRQRGSKATRPSADSEA